MSCVFIIVIHVLVSILLISLILSLVVMVSFIETTLFYGESDFVSIMMTSGEYLTMIILGLCEYQILAAVFKEQLRKELENSVFYVTIQGILVTAVVYGKILILVIGLMVFFEYC